MATPRENYLRIRRELGEKIAIVGVTKFQPVESVREAVDAGLSLLANNYVQDGAKLMEELGSVPVQWHFIGHIQSRKAKLLTRYDWVQSLDRLSVAGDLEARLSAEGKTLSVLVEVNIGDESSKSGIAPGELGEFLEGLTKLPHLKPRGLMGMPPPLNPVDLRRPYFKRLKALYDGACARYGFDTLSMGTSDDYLIAVEEGATMVRLGTTLFGARPPKG